MSDKPSLVEVSSREKEDSFYKEYAPLCELCKRAMDHPPIKMMIEAPTLKAPMDKDAPPYAEGLPSLVCRHCVLEALAPIEEEHESNPRAGWYFRALLRGDLEPRGVTGPRKAPVEEEVGKDKTTGHGDSEGDSE